MAKLPTTIREKIANKLPHERATLKGLEFAKLQFAQKVARAKTKTEIEIVEINAIDGGVEVFARAWDKKGNPIGFGSDGTVEIERFRIFNPPILVNDPQGDILIEWVDEITGQNMQRRLREDTEEALLQVLEHNIGIVGKDGGSIVAGKVGKTTDTFYADSGGSGYVGLVNQASWSSARGASSGGGPQQGATANFRAEWESGGSDYAIDRGFYPFDTSSIPDTATISAATFSVSVSGVGEGTGGEIRAAGLIQTTQASNTSLASDDYDNLTLDSAPEGTNSRVTLSDATGYHDFAMNATGIGWISKTSYTKLGLRLARDLDNSAPPVGGRRYVQVYNVAQTGTTDDPKLVVTYSTAVDVTVSSSVLAATFSAPASTQSGGAAVASSVVASTFSTQAPVASGGATISAGVLTATFSLPTPDIITPDAMVNASVLSATFSAPAPTVSGDAPVAIGAPLSATFSTVAPDVAGGAGATPTVLSATFSTPAPTIVAIGNINVTASVLTATFSIPAPTITTEQNALIEAGVLTATFSIPAITVTAIMNVTVSASVLTATFSAQLPTRVGGLWVAQPRVQGTWTPQPRAV